MLLSELKDGDRVILRTGRAGREAPEYGPWREATLSVMRREKPVRGDPRKDPAGTIILLAIVGEGWAEYDEHDYCEPNEFVAEDYYMEIRGLEGR